MERMERLVFLLLAAATLVSDQTSERYRKNPLTTPSVVCAFNSVSEVVYEDGQIKHSLPDKQSKPLVFSFTGLDTKAPEVRALAAGGITYESKLISVGDNSRHVLIEVTPNERNVFIYSIYREHGVAIWTKHYLTPVKDDPIGIVAMGKCQ